jgi:methionine-rich copper-binding protein CopC
MNPIQAKSLPALAAALAAAVLTTIPARGAPWTPADLPQPPALWLDASDATTLWADTNATVAATNNGAIARWNDKSGNGRNFTQGTAGNRPTFVASSINGLGAATFNGSAGFMSAGDTLDMRTNSLTVMSAVRYATSNNSGAIIGKTRAAGGDGRWSLFRSLSGGALGVGSQNNSVLFTGGSIGAFAQVADSSTSVKIDGFVADRSTSGSLKIWSNGVSTATASFTGNSTDFNSTDQLLLGAYQNSSGTTPPTAGSYLNGVISEVVVVQTAMSDTDRQKLEGYLAWKWGMQANLPVGHPYKSAAPESSDTTPPAIVTLNPADDATGVLTYANLAATFDEFVQKGTGNITLKKSADNSTVETFDVATSPRITVSGSVLTIDPTGYLEGATGYYVEIAATAVKDTANNFFAGIANTTTWNFTTGVADTTAPTIATLSPADNATGADLVANLVATFDENIQKGTGNITLKKSADNSTVETFNVATSPRITVSGATLTIDPTANLALATGYYVQIDPTAIQDLSGNSFAGIADSTTWNFTTRAIVLYDDFAVNPNLGTQWTFLSFKNDGGTAANAAWNSGDKDLDLADGEQTVLRRTDATRLLTDPVMLRIKSHNVSGPSALGAHVGLVISQAVDPVNSHSTDWFYTFTLSTYNGTDWFYQVRRYGNTQLWAGSTFQNPTFPMTLGIERDGAVYVFKANGTAVYRSDGSLGGSAFPGGQDTLVYYHIMWGDDPATIMTATVDNFGISAATPTPYDTWANGTYSPALTAKLPTDNQDGDSLNNLQEFAFGTQPTVSTGEIVYSGGTLTTPGAPKIVAAAGTYSMVFGRRADYVAAGLTYTVQFSASLDAWVDNDDGTNPPVQVATDGTINAMSVPFVDFIDTPSGTQKPTFARVKVVQAP